VADDVEPIECRCYTLPHRHPLMIGKLPGFQLPFMVWWDYAQALD